MAEKKAIQEAIEDLKFMSNKQTEPLQRIAFNMAITICEQHLPKELDGEQHLKQMINTYEKAGHKIGVPPDELDKEAQIPSLRERYYTTEDMRKSYDAFRMRGFPHNTDSYGNETFEQFLESLK